MTRPLRILLAALTFALVAAIAERFENDVRSLITDWGKFAGCGYFESRVMLIGPEGPFFGRPRDDFFNFLWRHGPWISVYVVAFIPASMIHAFADRRRNPRDGLTRCGACGHILRGLTEPRCPECGLEI